MVTNNSMMDTMPQQISRLSQYHQIRIYNLWQHRNSVPRIREKLAKEDNVLVSTKAIRLFLKRRLAEISERKARKQKPRNYSKLTTEHLAFIDNEMEKNEETTAPELKTKLQKEFGVMVSDSTVKRARRKLGWLSPQTKYCQIVRDVNKEKRKIFCIDLLRNGDQFDDVIFTDESTVKIQSHVRLSFRRSGRRRRLRGVPKHPYQVHVWAGISRRGATTICIFTGRMNSIGYQNFLEKHLLPFISRVYPNGHRLWQDNDPKHTSYSTKDWLKDKNVHHWSTPPESPDLNPIELMWATLKYHLRKRVRPVCIAQLIDGIYDFWESVTPSMCCRYINHLYKVVPTVVAYRGAASGY